MTHLKPVTLLLSMIAMAGAATAQASDRCDVPEDQWQPQQALEQQLTDQGWTIKNIKVDSGCYEAYAIDADGKRREVYFDPQSLEPVSEDED
ncbi:MAG: PepSY domain-containing protein [Onishia taeanensis]|uniref:PepSY domain-containing protein n=1 Tax=Onishia taeanensis TaxID=284577 RepID=A0A328XM25_9GAMM|nr:MULTISPECIES: PepSY domain-containing protein [Halomonas]RAR60882.1 hypothetical protein BCL93_10687 [Halomonas taeanensis]